MSAWWASQGIVGQFFLIVAFTSTMIFIIQLVMTLIGLGVHDADVSAGMGHDIDVPNDVDVPQDLDLDHPDLEAHSSGLGMLSLRTVLAFMVGFGWTGTVLNGYDLNVAIQVVFSALVGFLFMLMVFWLMKMIYSLSDSGNVEDRNAKGLVGNVYIPIPGSAKGKGQVQVVVQGRMREFTAITHGEESLPTGKPVRITDVMDGGTMVVEAVEKGVE